MTEILLGFVGALALLILLFCGGLVGWFAHKTFIKHTTPTAEPLTEKERRKLIAEQQAWNQMQNYNLETAYGMTDQGGDG
jgi:hypothetical protein